MIYGFIFFRGGVHFMKLHGQKHMQMYFFQYTLTRVNLLGSSEPFTLAVIIH